MLDEQTREKDVDRDAEKWTVTFDGELVARMRPHPDHQWPLISTPAGRDKVQVMRSWVWEIARAHGVNAENILEIKGECWLVSCQGVLCALQEKVMSFFLDPCF